MLSGWSPQFSVEIQDCEIAYLEAVQAPVDIAIGCSGGWVSLSPAF